VAKGVIVTFCLIGNFEQSKVIFKFKFSAVLTMFLTAASAIATGFQLEVKKISINRV